MATELGPDFALAKQLSDVQARLRALETRDVLQNATMGTNGLLIPGGGGAAMNTTTQAFEATDFSILTDSTVSSASGTLTDHDPTLSFELPFDAWLYVLLRANISVTVNGTGGGHSLIAASIVGDLAGTTGASAQSGVRAPGSGGDVGLDTSLVAAGFVMGYAGPQTLEVDWSYNMEAGSTNANYSIGNRRMFALVVGKR